MDAYRMTLFPLIFLALITFVFSSLGGDTVLVDSAIDAINCPMPAETGVWKNFAGVTQYTGAAYNKPSASNNTKTMSCTPIVTADGIDYHYGEPTIVIGWFYYIGDSVSEYFYKGGAYLVLLGNFLFPVVSIMALIPPAIATIIVAVIAFLYLMLGIGLYKVVSPFVH